MTAKQEALASIEALPEGADAQQIATAIRLWADSRTASHSYSADELAEIDKAIAESDADFAAGRFKTTEEVRELLKDWSKEWATK